MERQRIRPLPGQGLHGHLQQVRRKIARSGIGEDLGPGVSTRIRQAALSKDELSGNSLDEALNDTCGGGAPGRTGLNDRPNHLTGDGGATAASVWPLALSALATKPEAFISSMNSRR